MCCGFFLSLISIHTYCLSLQLKKGRSSRNPYEWWFKGSGSEAQQGRGAQKKPLYSYGVLQEAIIKWFVEAATAPLWNMQSFHKSHFYLHFKMVCFFKSLLYLTEETVRNGGEREV